MSLHLGNGVPGEAEVSDVAFVSERGFLLYIFVRICAIGKVAAPWSKLSSSKSETVIVGAGSSAV